MWKGEGGGGQKVGNRYKQLRKLEDIKVKTNFLSEKGTRRSENGGWALTTKETEKVSEI